LRFKVNFEVGQSLGLSVEMTEGSIGVDKKKKKVGMQQVVTRVDSRSPSERAGLKKGDVILEVNGHSTQGQSNKKVVSWIRNSFRVIEFLVKREVGVSAGEDKENGLNVRDDQGSNEEQLNEEAQRLAAKAILESMNRLMEEKQT
jgi:C-terminal processing protease CtpA/Prc